VILLKMVALDQKIPDNRYEEQNGYGTL